jgi:prepilin-type N-terminal cleavage/methylation domain-containing protein
MMIAIRRRLAIQKKDAGVTLVELMVAMLVFGILSAIVVSLYTAANKSVLSTSNNDQNTQAAGNAMAELTRVIRGATTNPVTGGSETPAFPTIEGTLTPATSNSLLLYSYVDSSALTPTPYLVQFTIDGTTGQLDEKRWAATTDSTGLFSFPAITTTPSFTRTFPGKITSTAAAPLFSYLDNSNPTPVVLGGTVASGDLDNIAAVTVTIVSQSSTNSTIKPATLQNTVGLPNVTLEANS